MDDSCLSGLSVQLEHNKLCLFENSYPGRGIIVGLDESGKKILQIYWIMGRSENSRNRIFVQEKGEVLKTEPFDSSKVKDSSLIIYKAMDEDFGMYAVSNGQQTDQVLLLLDDPSFGEDWSYEPDAPNFTPRISARWDVNYKNEVLMSILKKSPLGDACNHCLYRLNLSPGVGYGIHTYLEDEDPLPSYYGEPFPFPLKGSPEEILEELWEELNKENMVSLAIKVIDLKDYRSEILIKNKLERS